MAMIGKQRPFGVGVCAAAVIDRPAQVTSSANPMASIGAPPTVREAVNRITANMTRTATMLEVLA